MFSTQKNSMAAIVQYPKRGGGPRETLLHKIVVLSDTCALIFCLAFSLIEAFLSLGSLFTGQGTFACSLVLESRFDSSWQ